LSFGIDQAVNFFFVFYVDPYGFRPLRAVKPEFLVQRANFGRVQGPGLLFFDSFENGPLDPGIKIVGLPWLGFSGGQVEAEDATEELALSAPLFSGDLLELVRQSGRHGEAEVSTGA
jgi:hypothetical protein